MILNEEYYRTLFNKFKSTNPLDIFNNNTSHLTTKLILEHYERNQPIHFNFQNSEKTMLDVGKCLFIDLAKDIYRNHNDLPTLKKGSKLRDKRKHADGKNHNFIIKGIINGTYHLEDIKNKAELKPKYDYLVKNFIPIEQGTKQKSLQEYMKFFSHINNELKLDFIPTNFEKKIVFIAKKTFWESLSDKNKIPSTYLPNSREEKNASEIRSIPALQDSLVYFTPKYEICFSNIISKGKKVKVIVIFDTETDNIEQIISDKNQFGFNLVILSNNNTTTCVKYQSIPCWNWFKEEIKIINAL